MVRTIHGTLTFKLYGIPVSSALAYYLVSRSLTRVAPLFMVQYHCYHRIVMQVQVHVRTVTRRVAVLRQAHPTGLGAEVNQRVKAGPLRRLRQDLEANKIVKAGPLRRLRPDLEANKIVKAGPLRRLRPDLEVNHRVKAEPALSPARAPAWAPARAPAPAAKS
jgi:hypothetical protein